MRRTRAEPIWAFLPVPRPTNRSAWADWSACHRPVWRSFHHGAAYIEMTLKESSLDKVAKSLAHATYSSGTDMGFPAGAQAYEQISVGGLVGLPQACVALISPRRGLY